MRPETQNRTSKIGAEREPGRTLDEIRRQGNRLKSQRSLYLRQHAYNPVDWYPWSAQALEQAQREDKPIFLSIGYAACHWCHVMEKEVFERDDVADLLNRHFIAIKVDREERPDLDRVYMDAVVAMTGSGGWPLSVFLTPAQKPFFGATFIPHGQFVRVLVELQRTFRDERSRLDAIGERLTVHLSSETRLEPGTDLDPAVFDSVVRTAKQQFDAEWGGLVARMKFPMPVIWSYLLHQYRKNGDPQLGQMLRHTLDQMSSGGMRDHIAGGFHRYAVDRTWLVPHFEKMLYDNAQLASLYLEASVALDEPRYAEVGRDTLDFLIAEMTGEDGEIFASLDADSGGEEGSFYVWTPEEITAVVGQRDGPVLATLLGVEPQGNFGDKSVLTRRANPEEVANRFDRDVLELYDLFDRHRAALRQARDERIRPLLDRKVITAWCGLAVGALAQGFRRLGDERYRRASERAADYLWRVQRNGNGGLLRSSYDGVAEHAAILDDYAFFAQGLLELYQATGERRHLVRALALTDHVRASFRHARAGFYLTGKDQLTPLGRQVELTDGVLPSGNAVMYQVLLTAGALTGKADYLAQLKADLKVYAAVLKRAGLEMAGWLDVALKHRGPFYEVVVAGDPDAADTRALLAEYRRRYPAHAVLVHLPAHGPDASALDVMPAVAGKRSLEGKATAFVCKQNTCKLPTHDPDVMSRQISAGWHH